MSESDEKKIVKLMIWGGDEHARFSHLAIELPNDDTEYANVHLMAGIATTDNPEYFAAQNSLYAAAPLTGMRNTLAAIIKELDTIIAYKRGEIPDESEEGNN